jgi:hypothetical protein
MLRHRYFGFCVVIGILAVWLPHRAVAQMKPNILVIMADDVGWMNVSSYGGDIMGAHSHSWHH